ncbi:MAG TPA: N-acetylmuramoyl-L-alanine amidase [Actinospica sp.]|nr:N-acetylmuramoyl-L-alanine amidase [Actinospica sp.]
MLNRNRRRCSALAAALATCALTATACTATAAPVSQVSPLPALGMPSDAANTQATRATSTTSTTPAAPASTPAGASAAQASAASLTGKVVVIDPGHNGGNASHAAEIAKLVPMGFGQYKTCDTTGTDGDDGYPEYAFTLSVSDLVAQLLEQRGIKVVMTRTTNDGVGPCVNQRAAIGNDAHADAAISIHGDGFGASGHGFQIIQATRSEGGVTNDARSNELSRALHATFVSESGLTAATYIGDNGYETRSDLAGLNLSTVPKVLVELGNMKNPGDIALMESTSGRARFAKAIADGILDYLTQS